MHIVFQILVKIIGVVVAVAFAGAVALALFTVSLLPDLPTVETLRDVHLKVPLRIYSAQGSLLAEYGEQRREPVRIDEVPQPLIHAVLAAEDDSFYSHPGVDFLGVLRAAVKNLQSGAHEQGASTITMQVARNYFLTPEKTYTRKLREVLLAFRMEQFLTKDQILELYLNKIFLGHRAYGFAAAARVYYGKPLDELSVEQFAMLAGLPKAPSRDNPLTNPRRAQERRDYVLRRMHKLGYLDKAAFEVAIAAPLTASKHDTQVDLEAPYVAEMVRTHMVEHYGEEAYWRGFKVYTTVLDANQIAANRSLRNGLKVYDRRHGFRGVLAHHALSESTSGADLDQMLKDVPAGGGLLPALVVAIEDKAVTAYTRDHEVIEIPWDGMKWARTHENANSRGPVPENASQILRPGDAVYVEPSAEGWRLAQLPDVAGALVSLRPNDGAIRALTGGFDFYLSKFNRAIQADRQPGSNIKPFIYSAALDHGFTPASLVSGAPIVVRDEFQGSVWRPENYSGKFFGPTRLRKALSLSLNLVSVRILRAIGSEAALEHLAKFGFERDRLPRGLSLALGSGTVKPVEMVTAYAVLANGGYLVKPYLIDWVEDEYGAIVEQASPLVVCRSCPIQGVSADAHDVSLPRHRQAPRVLDAANQFLITSMMQEVIKSGTGRRARKLGRSDLAGKTGTTNDFRDAWFSGFNTDVVTTVWVGFDDSETLGRGEAGSKVALPIWIDYMEVALKGAPERPLLAPDNIVTAYVHNETGQAVPPGDPSGFSEFFKSGTAPRAAEAIYSPGGEAAGRISTPQSPTEGLF